MSRQDEYKQFYKFLQIVSQSSQKEEQMAITKGKIPSAKRVVIYGPEGIGKSTIASNFPNPVFIDTEGSTKELDVARFDTPTKWEDIKEDIKEALTAGYGTLVIDTADWAEQYCIDYTCRRLKVKGIEDIGYGKGYTYLAEDFQAFLKDLDLVINAGINVVFTAHAQMRKFEQPDEMGAYDRWELKLHKKLAALLKEWADMVLFCNYKTTVISDSKTKSKKATGGSRIMYTTHHPCWDAKNRFNLPEELPMEYESIADIFKDVKPNVKPVKAKAEINEDDLPFKFDVKDVPVELHTDFKDCPSWFAEAMLANDLTEDDVHSFTVFKGNDKKLNANKVQDYPEAYMKALTTGISISKIIDFKNGKV